MTIDNNKNGNGNGNNGDDKPPGASGYLWSGGGDDTDDVARLEQAVSALQLQTTTAPRWRRTWLAPLVAAMIIALLAFGTLTPAQIPTRFLGLFTDAPVTALSLDGGSVIEIDVIGAGAERTAKVGELMRERGATVTYTREGKIIVELPGFFGAEARRWSERMSARGRLSMAWSIDSPQLATLAAGLDSATVTDGVRSDGKRLFAIDRTALQKRLDATELPAGQRWALERHDYAGKNGEQAADPDWAAHVVTDTRFEWSGFAGAHLITNPATGDLELIARLYTSDHQAFADLTRENIGRRLAILLDGEVLMAPTIASEIDGGELAISLGSPSSDAEKKALANIIGATEIDAELDIAHVESVFPRIGPGAVAVAKGLLAAGLGLVLFLGGWLLERRSRGVDPHVSKLRGVSVGRGRSVLRVGVGVLIIAAVAALSRIPIGPAPDHQMWQPLLGDVPWLPFLGAFALASVLGALVPALGLVAGRRRHTAVAIALGLAASLAWSVLCTPTQSLHAMTLAHAAPLAFLVGLLGLAWVGSRFSSSSGFVLVILGLLFHPAVSTIAGLHGMAATTLFSFLGLGAMVAGATAYLLRREFSTGEAESRRVAVGFGAALVTLLSLEAVLAWSVDAYSTLVYDMPGLPIAALVSGLVLAALHFRQVRASGVRVVGDRAQRSLRGIALAVGAGALYVALLVVAGDAAMMMAVGPLTIAFVTAAALDDHAATKAIFRNPELAVAAELHDARLADPIRQALTRAGIDVHLRSEYVRHLLGPLGTFAPIAVMVPAHRLGEARTVVEGQL